MNACYAARWQAADSMKIFGADHYRSSSKPEVVSSGLSRAC
jgi:hypothetical protein